jgi:hypothetical protein
VIICVDFDGTVVRDDRAYDDLETPLELVEGAEEALRALKLAGHTLILSSGRANRSLREDWRLNPLWRDKLVPFDELRWRRNRQTNQDRFEQMVVFVEESLPGVFDSIDEGEQGKPSADLFIDDRAVRLGGGWPGTDWATIMGTLGDQEKTDEQIEQAVAGDGAAKRRPRHPPQEVRRRPPNP